MSGDSEAARLAEIAEHHARKARLEEQYGVPEHIPSSDALRLLMPGVNVSGIDPDDVIGHIYRDQEAADGWLASNLEHHGHPALGTAVMADGRVVGVLNLRPSLDRAREEVRRAHEASLTDEEREEADGYHQRVAAGGCRNRDCPEQGRPESAVLWECPGGHREEFLYCAVHGPAHLDLFLRDGGRGWRCQSCTEWMTPRSAVRNDSDIVSDVRDAQRRIENGDPAIFSYQPGDVSR